MRSQTIKLTIKLLFFLLRSIVLSIFCADKLFTKINIEPKFMGGGRNVDDQNVDKPKFSERRNGLFSWSERRNQNVKNVFWVDQNYDNQNVENSILIDFRRSDLFWRHR